MVIIIFYYSFLNKFYILIKCLVFTLSFTYMAFDIFIYNDSFSQNMSILFREKAKKEK